MSPRYLVLRERLVAEWAEVRRAAERAVRTTTRARSGGPDAAAFLAAAGAC